MKEKVGAVLVIGGGVAGVQASLDLAESGFKVYLLDDSPSIGGVMAQLDKTFPTNDCAMCILAPKLVEAGRHPNIQLLVNSEIKKVEGESGNLEVIVTKRASYIDESKCTGCGVCAEKCPVEAIDEFNRGLSQRNAIYVNYPQAVPLKFVIDREKCIGCGTCKEVCKAGAVEYEQANKEITLEVGSIVLALGYECFDANLKPEYGYGRYPNVITSIEFERILSASGPYGGVLARSSDGEIPRKIAFIQCVGSRDVSLGNNYCSSACCMYAVKESIIAKEHASGVECAIFFMDMRAYGKEFDDYYKKAEEEGVRFVRARVSNVLGAQDSCNLIVRYVLDEEPMEEEFDLVVLSVGMRPPKRAEELAKVLGIELNEYGFCLTRAFSPVETSRPGIYVCGAFASPKDIPESVAQASGAAAKAGSLIASERWKLTAVKEYPPERDVSGEEPRIGAFICNCGINIGGYVNVPAIVEYVKTLPNVVYAEHNLYTCSEDTQHRIREKIREHNLNRVIVASCTPRTHEPLFRETVREAGLNVYLFEMANVRDQCSWVHMREHEAATEKAKDLVRSIIAKARLLNPLPKPTINISPAVLVIGGGLAGMTAALEVAKQGFEVHLVEKETELGGHLRHIHYLLEPENPQERLKSIVKEVIENERIHVYLNSQVKNIEGYIGNFKTTLISNGEERQIEHGVTIVAIGAIEYKPTEYLYGVDERVLTQRELEERLANDGFNGVKSVVMIQCVGSRTEARPNCSRICCSQAMKNALKIKELSPETEVHILYKDVRTYGFNEDYYREAANRGILFLRYDDEKEPKVAVEDGKLQVLAWGPVLRNWVTIDPDLLILSVATIPNPVNEHIAKMLKVPLTKDGFFLEAHMKLRPIDFATDGVFLCGLAHWPKSIEESISQACAAAARAVTILSKKTLEVEGAIASVDEDLCSGCRICESVCEYKAIEMREVEGKLRAHAIEAMCKGCGVCGSSCPTGSISMLHFMGDQLLAQVKAALGGG